ATMVKVTSAMPVGFRSRVPLKITSSILPPRRLLADCSPNTHDMASAMLLLPQPFDPTTQVMPSPNKTVVRSANDLNPLISSFSNLNIHCSGRVCHNHNR